MKIDRLAAPLGAVFLGLLATLAGAQPVTQNGLALSAPEIHAMAPDAAIAQGFVTITNTGTQADRLLSVNASGAGQVLLRERTVQGAGMRMHDLPDGLTIPAGGAVRLQPEGYQLSFIQLTQSYTAGETISVTLTFEHAGAIDLPFPVSSQAPIAAPTTHDMSQHSGH